MKEEAKTMLGLKVNKKLLQNHLSKTSGQVVLLKDLHNIGATCKGSSSNGIKEAVEELRKVPGNVVLKNSCKRVRIKSLYCVST